MKISRGVITRAQKVVVYGPEGIGKSTFAAQFPAPLFLDVENGTGRLDVARIDPAPVSWAGLLEEIKAFLKEKPDEFSSLVLDTADWSEQMCSAAVCAKAQKNGIEDFGYGKGYVYLGEDFGKLLNLLEDVIAAGYNVVVLAHAKMRKFEQPDELGSYDRWEMKLTKNVAPMVKEWADMVLFANYKTIVVATDNSGQKHKAQGGRRVMYTTHHPCWDAKNRHGLAEELPFDYGQIAHCIPDRREKAPATAAPAEPAPVVEPPAQEISQNPEPKAEPVQGPTASSVPASLASMMSARGLTEEEVRVVIGKTGYFPADSSWQVMEEQGFVDGWILPNFDYIAETIEADPNRLPF